MWTIPRARKPINKNDDYVIIDRTGLRTQQRDVERAETSIEWRFHQVVGQLLGAVHFRAHAGHDMAEDHATGARHFACGSGVRLPLESAQGTIGIMQHMVRVFFMYCLSRRTL